ncbi:hypothetical protein [Undibacterium crateris]|uniref:hypothetical protein n=1 Tax=Undibacterium crateris TaxID=2528175 RepID=UPI0013898765|nr:hypothetical protein [Undibacterium crateris]NDI85054.1 hypothetical protein [Undibacterium crateris]
MVTPFVRQLGYQSGVQLNPLKDNSDSPDSGNSDQVFALVMRATRGRIDKAFEVSRSKFTSKLGRGEPLRNSVLNEAHIHVSEALDNGAYKVIVSRLVPAAAALSYIVLTLDNSSNLAASVSPTIPATPYLLAIQHLECFNDGLIVDLHADQFLSAGAPVPNSIVTLKLRDASGSLLYEFTGSLTPSQDDFGRSQLLTDVVERSTSDVVVSVGSVTAIPVASNAYGRDANGNSKIATTPVQIYFNEGGTGYSNADYQRAVNALKNTDLQYGYLVSGGNQAAALLSKLALLAKDTNTQLAIDLDGSLSPSAAIAQLAQLNIDSHYVHAYWSPLKSDDPLGINGKVLIGTATYNVALRCARNAQKNAKGFAPKNFPIAGKAYPLNRTGIVPVYIPSEPEDSDLAQAKINQVKFQTYNGGGKYVFVDSLTCAQVSTSFKKLISVAEMSSSIDNWVSMFGKEILQLPMSISVKKTQDFLKALFEGAQSSGWIKESEDLGGAAFQFAVAPNQQKPADLMDISYSLRYDGTTRQITISQTLSR